MKRIAIQVAAEALFLVHLSLIAVILFGWLLPPPYYYAYAALVAGDLLLLLVIRHCFLSLWEFKLHRMVCPSVPYDTTFFTYYGYKFFKQHLSILFLQIASLSFLVASLVLIVWRIFYL